MTAQFPVTRTFKFSETQWQLISRECDGLGIGLNDYARLCFLGNIGTLRPLPTYSYEFDPAGEGNAKSVGAGVPGEVFA